MLCGICRINESDFILMDKYHSINEYDINNYRDIIQTMDYLRMIPICKSCFKTELKFIRNIQRSINKIDIPIRWITWADYESIQFDRKNRPYAYEKKAVVNK